MMKITPEMIATARANIAQREMAAHEMNANAVEFLTETTADDQYVEFDTVDEFIAYLEQKD
jgi:hypothetical protein